MNELKPNFKKAYITANEILINSYAIDTIPCDSIRHAKEETDIKLCSYGKAIKKYGLAVSDLGSDDALIVEKLGRYIIFYNENTFELRKKWSITHEMGHFYLDHNLDFKNISEELRNIQEIEANFFAAQLLMPDCIIWELVKRYQIDINKNFLENKFKVSGIAASKRLETLYSQFDYRDSIHANEEKDLIIVKFGNFINSMKPRGYYTYSSYEDEEEMQRTRDTWLYGKKRY